MSIIRPRKTCPFCGTLQIRKRSSMSDYRCEQCDNVFKIPRMSTPAPNVHAGHSSKVERQRRLRDLKLARTKDPDMSTKDAIFMAVETRWYVEKYWDECKPD